MAKKELSPFTLDVIRLIKKIPAGKIATYSQIARLGGKPGGARLVVWVLHSCSDVYALPWQRVVNTQGRIAFNSKKFQLEQRRLLKKEGVTFKDAEHVDLEAHKWAAKSAVKKAKAKADSKKPRMFA